MRVAQRLGTRVEPVDAREIVAGDARAGPARQIERGIDDQPADIVRRGVPLSGVADGARDRASNERVRQLIGQPDEEGRVPVRRLQ